jgi:hypothetical protein
MNEWARTSERAPCAATEFDRRVYRREFAAALGYGITWFRHLEKQGTIPAGRRDPGGKREWWFASEVHATLAKLGNAAERAAA